MTRLANATVEAITTLKNKIAKAKDREKNLLLEQLRQQENFLSKIAGL